MNISVFGLGYVGSVTAACFADKGTHVIGVEVNPDKLTLFCAGQSSRSVGRSKDACGILL